MVDINLTPWRAQLRRQQKKRRCWWGGSFLVVLLIGGMIFDFNSRRSHEKIVSSKPPVIKTFQPILAVKTPEKPVLVGYFHQANRTWGLVKSPNGDTHEMPEAKIANVEWTNNNKLSLDLQNVKLSDALRLMAKFMHRNLLVSPKVKGMISLHLQDVSPIGAFDLLIASQGLAKATIGEIEFVTSHREWLKRKEADIKLQEVASDAAPLLTRTWQIRYAKAEDIARLLQEASYSLLTKRGHVRVDPRTNQLYVQDTADSLAKVTALIQQFDVSVRQIRIEARLASVDHDYERELGVNFAVHEAVHDQATHVISDTVSKGPHYSLAVATLADGSLLDVALTAMENDGHGELISNPSLFTANQQTASIESGEEIPYQEVSLSGGTGIAFKKAVLSLKVTPQIMPGNQVLLQLQVNQDRPSSRIVLGVPAISTRQMITNILVKNGQTVVLGGIYELNKEHDEQRVPFLGKIPLVGLLFQQQNVKENKRELLIFVTPSIISEK